MKPHPTAAVDLFGAYHTPAQGSVLAETWEYPPFSVLNAREGWWQARKRQWLAMGIESELGRGGALIPNGGNTAATDMTRGGVVDVGQLAASDAKRTELLSGRNAPGRSLMPSADYSNRQRGDGKGRPIG